VSDLWNKLDNYFQERKLGDIVINSFNLNNEGKINIKSLMEKRLEKLGINYNLREIDKIVSFTKL
jgi:hypothetical protein